MTAAKNPNPLVFLQRSLRMHSISSAHDHEDEEEDDDESVFVDDGNQNDIIAKRMNLRVNAARTTVLLMLLAAGVATAALTYTTILNDEKVDFQVSYDLFVDNIINSGISNIIAVNLALQSLSEKITAEANRSGQMFPFVTTDQFEIWSQHARRMSGIEMLAYSPIIRDDDKLNWANYSQANQGWLAESRALAMNSDKLLTSSSYIYGNIPSFIYEVVEQDGIFVHVPSSNGTYLPVWQSSPPPFSPNFINYNLISDPSLEKYFLFMQEARCALITESMNLTSLGSAAINPADHLKFHKQFLDPNSPRHDVAIQSNGFSQPHSILMQPVFESLDDPRSPLVAIILGVVSWDQYFINLLPEGVDGIHAVLSNTCNQSCTYMLNGSSATYLDEGDLHDVRYNTMRRTLDATLSVPTESVQAGCPYNIDLYPSGQLQTKFHTKVPSETAAVVASAFFAMAVTFFMYDRFVRVRNDKVVSAAVRSDIIVSSLFPSNIRDRLFAAEQEADKHEVQMQLGAQSRIRNFLAHDAPSRDDLETEDIMFKTKPIADLFPETSILFADIAGFTAWSSAREPHQVFVLLETVYRAFDEIAKRRRVFKVETVGDCYVAATGLPEPRMDHAVAICRFAKDCMFKMQSLTRKLEVALGPDTADLAMRMGIHSGPVTAGVLRGERSRFQLFGDTMNTASRMESTGIRDKIQISQDTANLLIGVGKKQWVIPREDIVYAKGKGEMRTYWLNLSKGIGPDTSNSGGPTVQVTTDVSVSSEDESENKEEQEAIKPSVSAKIARLINWNSEILLRLLKSIVAHRKARGIIARYNPPNEDFTRSAGMTILDEVEERICLPEFDLAVAKKQLPPDKIEVNPAAESQLYEYTAALAALYRDNPFHNFEHASHVTMSVSKLLSRIVAPSDIDFQSTEAKDQTLHDHTYGITSDPLTQFACVLSALIHDVDHTGVPNTQLAKENPRMAAHYKGRSIAEQNSVDMAWDLLFDDCYSELRRTIYTTDEELRRFRKLVVNSVMATDIMDKDLKELRNARWDRAFAEHAQDDDPLGTIQRKATIVIEHLIQASDVSHTMQHWQIYRKWNGCLFEEMYKAFVEGRAEKDPSEFWYKGEIGFFDFYIIPLAKKLKNCGVFGVSSDEYLNYAERNRKEWELRGQEIVSELMQQAKLVHNAPTPAKAFGGQSKLTTMNSRIAAAAQ